MYGNVKSCLEFQKEEEGESGDVEMLGIGYTEIVEEADAEVSVQLCGKSPLLSLGGTCP